MNEVLNESRETRKQRKKKQSDKLIEEITSKSNMRSAYEQVTGNKGAAGVDGVGVSDFNEQLNKEWPLIKTEMEKGEYRPNAVKRVKIPKPNGGPLSPLLSNIILDKLDKELERRGHRFVRYADDCSIYVKSKRAGERVMESISTYIEKELKVKVNVEKSVVTRPWRTRLLGFTFYHKKGSKGITVHRKSISSYKDKIRAITCRRKPYPMEDRMMQIRQLNQGWGNYFKLSEAQTVFRELDEWVRSRVRLCYWVQWKRVKTRVKQLEKLGVHPNQAHQWGNTRKGHWRTVHSPILTRTLNNAFLKKQGLLCLKEIVTPKAVYV